MLECSIGQMFKTSKMFINGNVSLYWSQMKILAHLNEEPLSRKPSKHDSRLLFSDARSKAPRVQYFGKEMGLSERSLRVHWVFSKSSLSIQRVFSERVFLAHFFVPDRFFFSVCALWVFPERSLSFLWVISNLPLSDLGVISEWYLKVPSVCPELPWVLIWSEYCDTGVGLSDNLKSGLLALWSCFIACEECSLAPWLIMGQDGTDYIWDDNIVLV